MTTITDPMVMDLESEEVKLSSLGGVRQESNTHFRLSVALEESGKDGHRMTRCLRTDFDQHGPSPHRVALRLSLCIQPYHSWRLTAWTLADSVPWCFEWSLKMGDVSDRLLILSRCKCTHTCRECCIPSLRTFVRPLRNTNHERHVLLTAHRSPPNRHPLSLLAVSLNDDRLCIDDCGHGFWTSGLSNRISARWNLASGCSLSASSRNPPNPHPSTISISSDDNQAWRNIEGPRWNSLTLILHHNSALWDTT